MGSSFEPNSADKPILRKSIAISGAIKSGKTSLATALAYRFCCPITSFGDEVRRHAEALGKNPNDRAVLQSLGEQLANEDSERFIHSVVAHATPARIDNTPLIIEGLRHPHILDLMREFFGEDRLLSIHLYSSAEARKARSGSHLVTNEEFFLADSHLSEGHGRQLAEMADVILRWDDDFDGLFQAALRALTLAEAFEPTGEIP